MGNQAEKGQEIQNGQRDSGDQNRVVNDAERKAKTKILKGLMELKRRVAGRGYLKRKTTEDI